MEKIMLKTVICGLKAGDNVNVAYFTKSEKNSMTGTYAVVGIKKGRGKGGSMLAELQNSDSSMILNTKDSDHVLNITVNDVKFGYDNETEVPPIFEKDSSRAIGYKQNFKTLLKSTPNNPMKIRLLSEKIPEFNGVHEVISVKQLRGRSGQMVLNTASGLEIWSYRHSGVIDSLEVL